MLNLNGNLVALEYFFYITNDKNENIICSLFQICHKILKNHLNNNFFKLSAICQTGHTLILCCHESYKFISHSVSFIYISKHRNDKDNTNEAIINIINNNNNMVKLPSLKVLLIIKYLVTSKSDCSIFFHL